MGDVVGSAARHHKERKTSSASTSQQGARTSETVDALARDAEIVDLLGTAITGEQRPPVLGSSNVVNLVSAREELEGLKHENSTLLAREGHLLDQLEKLNAKMAEVVYAVLFGGIVNVTVGVVEGTRWKRKKKFRIVLQVTTEKCLLQSVAAGRFRSWDQMSSRIASEFWGELWTRTAVSTICVNELWTRTTSSSRTGHQGHSEFRSADILLPTVIRRITYCSGKGKSGCGGGVGQQASRAEDG